jgi:hypothetical protein
MQHVAIALACVVLGGCAATVVPGRDGSDVGTDAVATDVPAVDAGPCGDAGFCGPGTICVRGRCGGCCDLPPTCEPIPSGCSGALSCGCFANDPCGGCTTCQSVESDGVHCGHCMCLCAAPWTPIETPDGPRAISELRVGDLVYSMDHGAMVVVPIARAGRRPVAHHAVARIALANGAVLEISGTHPTADGRTLDGLQPGDRLGDETVVSVETEPYDEPFTYDILPASDSGAYFAAGALIGSTLR